MCALCTNERGEKAIRKIKGEYRFGDGKEANHLSEEVLIQRFIPNYNSSSPLLPNGLCKGCIFVLSRVRDGKDVTADLVLPQDYHVKDYHPPTRSNAGFKCMCTWCALARKSGLEFRNWQMKKKGKCKERENEDRIIRLCPECFLGIEAGKAHTCNPTEAQKTKNLLENLPQSVVAKVAQSYVAGQSSSSGGEPVILPRAQGGKPLVVSPVAPPSKAQGRSKLNSFTHEELIILRTETGLSARQMEKILAGMRLKLGRTVVDAGFHHASTEHNNQYRDFFTAQFTEFEDKDGVMRTQPFVYCSEIGDFLFSIANT